MEKRSKKRVAQQKKYVDNNRETINKNQSKKIIQENITLCSRCKSGFISIENGYATCNYCEYIEKI